ncbi:MAG: hypothetical protein ABIX46_01740 [Burkholderiaceae bacterium]
MASKIQIELGLRQHFETLKHTRLPADDHEFRFHFVCVAIRLGLPPRHMQAVGKAKSHPLEQSRKVCRRYRHGVIARGSGYRASGRAQ